MSTTCALPIEARVATGYREYQTCGRCGASIGPSGVIAQAVRPQTAHDERKIG